MSDAKYYWAWWATVETEPNKGTLVRVLKGIKGYTLNEPDLIAEMASLGKSRNDYEIYVSSHYGEAQVKHEINDLIAHKVKNIDKALQARYRTPQAQQETQYERR